MPWPGTVVTGGGVAPLAAAVARVAPTVSGRGRRARPAVAADAGRGGPRPRARRRARRAWGDVGHRRHAAAVRGPRPRPHQRCRPGPACRPRWAHWPGTGLRGGRPRPGRRHLPRAGDQCPAGVSDLVGVGGCGTRVLLGRAVTDLLDGYAAGLDTLLRAGAEVAGATAADVVADLLDARATAPRRRRRARREHRTGRRTAASAGRERHARRGHRRGGGRQRRRRRCWAGPRLLTSLRIARARSAGCWMAGMAGMAGMVLVARRPSVGGRGRTRWRTGRGPTRCCDRWRARPPPGGPGRSVRLAADPALERVLLAAIGGPDDGAAEPDPVLRRAPRRPHPPRRGGLRGGRCHRARRCPGRGRRRPLGRAGLAAPVSTSPACPAGSCPSGSTPRPWPRCLRRVARFFAEFDDAGRGPRPVGAGRRPDEGMRWRLVDGATVFETCRDIPADFDAFVARVDVAEGISLMADYLGGRRVTVPAGRRRHDATGRAQPLPPAAQLPGGLGWRTHRRLQGRARRARRRPAPPAPGERCTAPTVLRSSTTASLTFARSETATLVRCEGRQLFALPPCWARLRPRRRCRGPRTAARGGLPAVLHDDVRQPRGLLRGTGVPHRAPAGTRARPGRSLDPHGRWTPAATAPSAARRPGSGAATTARRGRRRRPARVPPRPGRPVKVAVTGATGLVGGQVVEAALAAGHEVVARDRPGSRARTPGRRRATTCERRTRGLTDHAALVGALRAATALVHCAAVYAFGADRAAEVDRVNTDGTRAVLRGCRRRRGAAGRRHVVLGDPRVEHAAARPAPSTTTSATNPPRPTTRARSPRRRSALETGARHGIPVVLALPTVVLGGPFTRLAPEQRDRAALPARPHPQHLPRRVQRRRRPRRRRRARRPARARWRRRALPARR